MTLKILIFVLVCLLVVLPIALTATCPSSEDVAPCTCMYKYQRVEIKCHGIDNEELVQVASKLRGKDVYNFAIENSALDFIPHDVFKGVRLSRLEIENSTLVALTDRNEGFSGLEDQLQELFTSNCVFKNEWDWTLLKNLKRLTLLATVNSLPLEIVGTDLMKVYVPNLEYIYFTDSNISFVSDHAFESYKNIRVLWLSQNKIKNVKRSMLPNPALQLEWFNISSNLIEQLPEDMFTNMPNLKFLFIEANKIIVLNEQTFSPIWEQLEAFYIQGNELHCDCRVSWLLETMSPSTFLGKCASPPELKGKKLFQLNSKDFACYV